MVGAGRGALHGAPRGVHAHGGVRVQDVRVGDEGAFRRGWQEGCGEGALVRGADGVEGFVVGDALGVEVLPGGVQDRGRDLEPVGGF